MCAAIWPASRTCDGILYHQRPRKGPKHVALFLQQVATQRSSKYLHLLDVSRIMAEYPSLGPANVNLRCASTSGLKSQQYGQWGTWLGQAFASCPDLQGTVLSLHFEASQLWLMWVEKHAGFKPKASTSYPTDDGTAVHFLVSGTGNAANGAKIEQCLSKSIQAMKTYGSGGVENGSKGDVESWLG